ncbi:MAG: dTMP kinase [Lachnospiraceae bacterium]|nr:dTMP kinase [Lachnospiraceae bacterium]
MILQKRKGRLIALEGIDGCGKSTQARLLAERMRQEGIACYATMEPTDSPIGSLIRQIMTGRVKTDNRVIAPLFVADRLDHLLNEVNGILHKVEEGITVISDRYYFSSYAYQGVDLPMDWVIRANEPNSSILRPALTVFLDIPPKLALERISRNRFQQELFEEEARLAQVRQKYMEAFRALEGEEQVAVLDGDKSPQAVAEAIWEEVRKYMID